MMLKLKSIYSVTFARLLAFPNMAVISEVQKYCSHVLHCVSAGCSSVYTYLVHIVFVTVCKLKAGLGY